MCKMCKLNDSIVQSEKKLWKACMVMLISWSLTWSPYALLFLLAISGQHHLLSHHSVMAAGGKYHKQYCELEGQFQFLRIFH